MFRSGLLKHRLIVTHSSHGNGFKEMQYQHTHCRSNAQSPSFSARRYTENPCGFFLTQTSV